MIGIQKRWVSILLLHWCASWLPTGDAVASAPASVPKKCADDAKFNDPAPAMHIYGNTWYVGSCALSAILITSKSGNVLIDGDTEQAPRMIEARIKELGFRIRDVHLIAISHAHLDHVGGIEKLRQDSAAGVLARGADADALLRGKGDRSDPQFLRISGFPAVANVRKISDGDSFTVGTIVITAHATAGHTPGSTSWTWESCEQSRCLHMVYADSLYAVSDDVYKFGDEHQHPGVVARFRASIATVGALPCDILLTPHPEASDMWQRLGANPSQPLIDPSACKRYAENAARGLEERLMREQSSP